MIYSYVAFSISFQIYVSLVNLHHPTSPPTPQKMCQSSAIARWISSLPAPTPNLPRHVRSLEADPGATGSQAPPSPWPLGGVVTKLICQYRINLPCLVVDGCATASQKIASHWGPFFFLICGFTTENNFEIYMLSPWRVPRLATVSSLNPFESQLCPVYKWMTTAHIMYIYNQYIYNQYIYNQYIYNQYIYNQYIYNIYI